MSKARGILEDSLKSLQEKQLENPELCQDTKFMEQILSCMRGLSNSMTDIIRAVKVLTASAEDNDEDSKLLEEVDAVLKELGAKN